MCDFKGRARKPCPAIIERLTYGELQLLRDAHRLVSELGRHAPIFVRNMEIKAWLDLDFKAQASIVKYLGASEQTHVRN